jgi:hypothetical protein
MNSHEKFLVVFAEKSDIERKKNGLIVAGKRLQQRRYFTRVVLRGELVLTV